MSDEAKVRVLVRETVTSEMYVSRSLLEQMCRKHGNSDQVELELQLHIDLEEHFCRHGGSFVSVDDREVDLDHFDLEEFLNKLSSDEERANSDESA